MGSSTAPAPMPDFAGIAAANAAASASQEQARVAREQLAWAKEQYASDSARLAPIIDSFISSQKKQDEFGDWQRDFFKENYAPLEKDFIDRANNWDSPERQKMVMGQAEADVAQQFEGARLAAAQNLKDYGVDPSSPRYAATDIISRTAQGAAAAGAANNARNQVEMQGIGLKQAAINVGRGYPGAATASYGGGVNAGNAGVSGTLNATQTGAQTMGTGTQWGALGSSALGTWGNISNNNYSNYMEGFKYANTPQSSGWGSALGLAGGMAMNAAMRYEEGGAVPMGASPSYGADVDDIPARLNAGEFIMPREAVSWFGEKAMHDMIMKAQKERANMEQQSGAVPDVMPAQNEAPRVVSGGAQQFAGGGAALPMRLPYGQRYNPETDRLDARDAKGIGFRGPVRNGDHIVSEYSSDRDLQYPSVYSGISDRDLSAILMTERMNEPRYKGDDIISQRLNAAQRNVRVPEDVDQRAYDVARDRADAGRSPFFETGRDPYPAWSPDQEWEEPALRTPRALPAPR